MIKRLISPINRLIELFNAAKIQKIVNRVPHIFLHLNSVCLSRIENEKARNPRRVPRFSAMFSAIISPTGCGHRRR